MAPLLLQLTFEFTAMETGLALVPLSVAILICAIVGARLSARFRAKRIIQVGYILAILGLIQITATMQLQATPGQLATGVLFGIGAGLIASQILNLILSSVEEGDTTATSGLNATFEQLGNSIGVALVGAIVLGTLIAGLQQWVVESPRIPEEAKPALTTALESRVQLVSDIQLQQVLDQETVTDELRERIIVAYRQERLRAFRGGMVFFNFYRTGGPGADDRRSDGCLPGLPGYFNVCCLDDNLKGSGWLVWIAFVFSHCWLPI